VQHARQLGGPHFFQPPARVAHAFEPDVYTSLKTRALQHCTRSPAQSAILMASLCQVEPHATGADQRGRRAGAPHEVDDRLLELRVHERRVREHRGCHRGLVAAEAAGGDEARERADRLDAAALRARVEQRGGLRGGRLARL
jgi:hypothetical protein